MPLQISKDEKIHRTYFAFISISTAISLILVCASPFLFYVSFAVLTANFLFSWRKWGVLHEPQNDDSNQELETIFKIGIGVSLGLFCIYFLQIYALAQMVLAITGGAVLSLFFSERILQSQEKLDERLRLAARESNLEDTKILLERGADPFAPDNTGRNTIYFAIRNNPNAALIIEAVLAQSAKPEPKLRDLFPGLSDFWGATVEERQHSVAVWSNWFDAGKALVTAFSAENRSEFQRTTGELINLYTHLFPRIANSLIHYLRNKTVHPNDFKDAEEGLPKAYADHLRLIELDANNALAISQALAKGKSSDSALSPLPVPDGWSRLASVATVFRFTAGANRDPERAIPTVEELPTSSPAPTPKITPSP